MTRPKRKTVREQMLSRCKHFTGLLNEVCEAGVPYEQFRAAREDGSGKEWLPCLKDGECVACEKRSWPTEEEVDAEEAAMEQSMQRTMKAITAISIDAEKRGFRKGNGGSAQMSCPVCEDGKLSYSVSSYNGHRWAKCETEDCVSFME